MQVLKGKPTEQLPKFWKEHGITQLYFEEDTEPYAMERDEEIRKLAKKEGIASCQLFFLICIYRRRSLQGSMPLLPLISIIRNKGRIEGFGFAGRYRDLLALESHTLQPQ